MWPLLLPSIFMTCQSLLWIEIKENPGRTRRDLATALSHLLSITIDIDFVKRALQRWGFTYKIVKAKHLNKFTLANINYYAAYVLSVAQIPWRRLKFADEASFQSRSELAWSQAFFLKHVLSRRTWTQAGSF